MTYIIIIIGFVILSWAVQNRLKKKFRKYSLIPLKSNLSGAEVAQLMLADNGIRDVKVTCVGGQLTDHYNPVSKTINLSEAVYTGRNAAAAAVAAHETGHAVQHAKAYSMLEVRSTLVPVQNASARIMNYIFYGLIISTFMLPGLMPWNLAILIIIGCYFIFTLFAFVTLPVEFDASKRALAWVEERGIVTPEEHYMAKDALKWAAMTYVVTALSSLAMLAFWIFAFLGND